MIVLGSKPGQHDACFALIRDGEPLFVYEVERFNRVKRATSTDLSVLFEGLAEYSISPTDIDLVTNCMHPGELEKRKSQMSEYVTPDKVGNIHRFLDWHLPSWYLLLRKGGFPENRIVNIRHHLCHVSGVYYSGPSNDAAILSVDGSGEAETAMLAHGRNGRISILRTTPHPHSLGHLYQGVTIWLGWGYGEEGKTMALAAYGDPQRFRRQLDTFIHIDDEGQFRYLPALRRGTLRYASTEIGRIVLPQLAGPRRQDGEEISQTHRDVAAAVQAICEEIMLKQARFLKRETSAKTLLLAGGVGLNSVTNGILSAESGFDDVVAYPQASDAGTALGGALYAYHNIGAPDQPRRWHMTHAYWGKSVDLGNLDAASKSYQVRGRPSGDITADAAETLAAGRVIGWVQGRSEIGPRALGNRSILANPIAPGIKDKVNGVKHRERWRPFAPSVLREDVNTYFEIDGDLPYMTTVARIRDEWREPLSSIGHVDGTARVQTVTEESNPLFYRLIQEFKIRTGLGVLLNTSLNGRGEPLVQTCEQALRLYVNSDLDAIVIGDRLFTDKTNAVVGQTLVPYVWNVRKLPRTRLLVVPGELPVGKCELLLHIVQGNPQARVALSDNSAVAEAVSATSQEWIVPVPALEPGDIAAAYDAVAFYVPFPGDKCVFEEEIYYSPLAVLSRRIMEEAGIPVYWIDSSGDVNFMRDSLYVHHDETPALAIPSAYQRFWMPEA
ncbi:carbamoyltransferase family protein [Streptantibioticus ferralitis]|uniref:Carbamoyltransferase C-terminal domain-containing protein n=1 Tax=Streptantibioticus ferralitis TaxID=236510 RepID=A0ABT5Z3B0_9ACTN|nr:carbamoyltransferase C-terminal domain-containing protein [Streptantibioticus ferralitis]MDF2257520.1 carbamoyltransferase C-terminal domain-containing protein [Streptantibioticus ferralitis]